MGVRDSKYQVLRMHSSNSSRADDADIHFLTHFNPLYEYLDSIRMDPV